MNTLLVIQRLSYVVVFVFIPITSKVGGGKVVQSSPVIFIYYFSWIIVKDNSLR